MTSNMLAGTIFSLIIYLALSNNGAFAQRICYSCVTSLHEGCKDPMSSNINTTDCSTNQNCIRYSYNISTDMETIRRCNDISVTCATLNESLSTTGITNFNCLTCDEDYCNSAITFGSQLTAIVLTILSTHFI